ncbi:hypothetical protein FWH30_03305 [Microgenomates group bacterium]|nr:hypothetical protein [Microgenomates group bacterium]
MPKSARLPVCLLVGAMAIGLVLVVVQLMVKINWWWRIGKNNLWQWEANKEETLLKVRGLSQFVNILRGSEWFSEEVVLNLDPDLLLAAHRDPWQLELNIDGEWQKLNNFGGFMDLLKATPLIWSDKLVYRSEEEVVYSYDINFLTEELLLSKEMAQDIISEHAPQKTFQVPLTDLELVGQVNGKIYVYYHNVLDEGVMLWTDGIRDYEDNLYWRLDPDIKGKIVNVGHYSLLLQGNNSNEAWTFFQLKTATDSGELAWQRLTEVYDGSLPGRRFVGVDDNRRLIFAQAESSRGGNHLILGESDMRLSEVTALSLETGQEIHIQGTAGLPMGVYQAALIPSLYEEELIIPESAEEATEAAFLAEFNKRREFLALVTEQSVYRMDLTTGEVSYQGSLGGLYGKPILRRVMEESWCFEATYQLQGIQRWIGMNLETGVALSGSSYCAESNERSRWPYVDRSLSRTEKERQLLVELYLPMDLRLTNGVSHSMTAIQTEEIELLPMREAGVLNNLFY